MASFMTNRGIYNLLRHVFQREGLPTNFYAYLIDPASTPTVETDLLGELTEASNYAEVSLTPNTTDFDTAYEGDGTGSPANGAYIRVKDLVFTASGGSLSARYLVITDDNATEALREVYSVHDLGETKTVSDGQTITVPDVQFTGRQPL